MGEAFQQLSIAFEEPLGATGEVLVLTNPFDLRFEGVADQGVDAGAFDSGVGVGEVFGEAKDKSEPVPFLTPPDEDYVKSKGGSHNKTMSDWLDESIIKIDFIEPFRKGVNEEGIESAGLESIGPARQGGPLRHI
jgi:hypothetical protein